ncbi:Retrotrans-gag domain-containing protein [Pyrenophora tritici-repentis]|nr:Retrotrans-gag domain-containing protein [Pyrenophora tritici-repentis]KAI0604679.1 Retrotrans-gag domain-containing protein [Pyrenophora tritici-repentis]
MTTQGQPDALQLILNQLNAIQADSAALKASNEALLANLAEQENRHSQQILELRQELESIKTRSAPAATPAITRTSAEGDQVRLEEPSGIGSNPATPPNANLKDLPRTDRLPDPPLFNGRRKDLPASVRKLRYKLEGNADRYPNERSRLLYAHSRLEKDAVALIDPLMDKDIHNVDQLVTFLEATYGDPNKELTALSRLSGLRQGKRSFTSHFAEFRRLAADTGLNEIGLIASLRNSLSHELQRAMVGEALPSDLNDYANLISTYDNNLRFLPDRPRRYPVTHPHAMEIDTSAYAPAGSSERQKRIKEGRCFKCNQKARVTTTVPSPLALSRQDHRNLRDPEDDVLVTDPGREKPRPEDKSLPGTAHPPNLC